MSSSNIAKYYVLNCPSTVLIFLDKHHVMQCLHIQGDISFSTGWREMSKNPLELYKFFMDGQNPTLAGSFKHGTTP